MRIDLVWLGSGVPPDWALGETICPGISVATLGGEVERHADATSADALLHWNLSIAPPMNGLFERLLAQSADVWHAGLLQGAAGKPAALDAVEPTWMLNCDPGPDRETASWRLSLASCLVRTEVVRALRHVDSSFTSIEGASLELGHRWLSAGALIRFIPDLAATPSAAAELPLVDELRFVQRRYGRRWVLWATWRMSRWGCSRWALIRAARTVLREPQSVGRRPFVRTAFAERRTPSHVTVLIPTLERYSWLEVVLRQLGDQTVAPYEVIIVDQTPAKRRRDDLCDAFPQLPLRVLQLDRRGQSTARNAGIAASTGDAILFVDDDDEVPRDLIERHLERIAPADVDASCGVAVEPGEEPRRDGARIRTSSVFPTNNTLLRRAALASSGLFDVAYDHGIRADGDLGMRLHLSGAHLLLDADISVLHHRAPAGGLREYGARKVTYRGSRASYLERNYVTATEVYLARRYFSTRQQTEMLALRRWGSLSRHGTTMQRAWRAAVQLLLLPNTSRRLRSACEQADELLARYPDIPELPDTA